MKVIHESYPWKSSMKVIHESHPWQSMTGHVSQIATLNHFQLVFLMTFPKSAYWLLCLLAMVPNISELCFGMNLGLLSFFDLFSRWYPLMEIQPDIICIWLVCYSRNNLKLENKFIVKLKFRFWGKMLKFGWENQNKKSRN